jgi:N-acetylglutamate synthase-like GNAT family acetyltransferase
MLAEVECASSDLLQRLVSPPKPITNGHHPSEQAPKGQIIIREATTSDAPAIVELTNVVFRRNRQFSCPRFESETTIQQLLKHGKLLLAEREKAIIGCAYLEPHVEASRLELLAVIPSRQRAGVGSQLLEAAERLSVSMQCFFMHVRVVNVHWQTIRFCRHRGYVQFGIESLTEHEPASPHCHFVKMCKQLNADRLAF